MAQIYNNELSKEIINGAKIQTSRDNIPNQLADKVVPVMEVNPKLLRRTDIVFANGGAATGSLTIATLSPDKDFYVVSATIHNQQDAACDNVSTTLRGTINGAVINIHNIRRLATTASDISNTISFPFPLKLDRNTNITLVNSFAAGSCAKSCAVVGYYDESTRA